MIADTLVVMEAPEIKGASTKEEIVRFLLDKQNEIEASFPNDEYIKLDVRHGEVVGIKSTAVISDLNISDLTALNWVISKNEKYKDSEIINLGNVKMLYEEFGKRE